MKRLVLKAALILFLAGLLTPLSPLYGQDEDPARTVRNIRVRKIALNLRGEVVTLISVQGTKVTGKLVDADFDRFLLEAGGKRIEVPINQVTAVILSPGIMEGVLTGLSGALVGGFGVGVVTLALPETGSGTQFSAGLIGAALGTWLGYKTFYQEEVIVLD